MHGENAVLSKFIIKKFGGKYEEYKYKNKRVDVYYSLNYSFPVVFRLN